MNISLNQIAQAIENGMSAPVGAAGFADSVNQVIQGVKNQNPTLDQVSNAAQAIAGGIAIAAAISVVAPEIAVTAAVVAAGITTYKSICDIAQKGGFSQPDIGDLITVLGNAITALSAGTPAGAAATALNIAGVNFSLAGIIQSNVPGGLPSIVEKVENYFNKSVAWRPRKDPLTLDLDGDGIETIAPSTTNPIYFDHDADGVKSSTGWISADDGFLVMDRNGNGTIDDGTELFGDATPVVDPWSGITHKAADGFAALDAQDTNGDGKVDSSDANWSQLRVWRDLNQDGVSQANELFTLDALGIGSIKVAKTANSQTLTNGNQIADLGSYTKTDGSQGTMGEVNKMADVNLIEDTFHSVFTDQIPLADGVIELPEMQGSGKVRDLHQAASQSTDLKTLLSEFSQATTRQEERGILDQLLEAWADTSGMYKTLQERVNPNHDPMGYVVSYQQFGGVKMSDYENQVITVGEITSEISPEWQPIVDAWEKKIHILEAFNGRYFFKAPGDDATTAIGGAGMESSGGGGGGGGSIAAAPQLTIMFSQQQVDLLNQSYDALKESVYSALLLQTRFKSLFDEINLQIDSNGIKLDYSSLEQEFRNRIAADSRTGLSDLIEFNRYAGPMLAGSGWTGNELAVQIIDGIADQDLLHSIYADLEVGFSSKNGGTGGNDLIYAEGGNDTISTWGGDDVVFSGAGDDSIDGGAGNDTLYGALGNDNLKGGDGDDVAYGGANNDSIDGGIGNDVLYGEDGNDNLTGGAGSDMLLGGGGDDALKGGSENDTLIGGTGNDALYGGDGANIGSGSGSDVYIFSKGDGADWIADSDPAMANAPDTIEFTDVTSTELRSVERSGYDLVIKYGSADQVTVFNYFYDDWYKIELIKFSDGVTWDIATTRAAAVLNGTAGADTLSGSIYTDPLKVNGYEGNDSLAGGGFNDLVVGGSGDDTLKGSGGNDTLSGGTGNDVLYGGDGSNSGSGADVYRFSKGDGSDWIADYDPEMTNAPDTIEFTDVASTELRSVERSGNDLVIKYGTSDQVTVFNYFYDNWYKIEQIKFSDGVAWDIAATKLAAEVKGTPGADTLSGLNYSDAIKMSGYEGNDSLTGSGFNDLIDGGSGDDTLKGSGGKDTLIGGTGNDVLYGGDGSNSGSGADVYRFSKGDGADWIADQDPATTSAPDTIEFTDVASTELRSVTRSGNDLLIKYGVSDQVTVFNYFYDDWYKIEQVKFSDGVTWGAMEIANAAASVYGTTGSDKISTAGFSGPQRVHALDGNDSVIGSDYADLIDGGAGDDTLKGGYGIDTLIGGTGNDLLCGNNDSVGNGADTYRFSKGDGNDWIWDSDASPSNIDVIEFTDVASTELRGVERSGNDLVIKYGTNDQVNVGYYFYSDSFKIEQIKFSDGVTWDVAATKAAAVINGSSGADTLSGASYSDGVRMYGFDGNDSVTGGSYADLLNGGAGDDTLKGGYGIDTLIGGAGNDLLCGNNDSVGNGADTYRFSKGDGNDWIWDSDASPSNIDVIEFTDVASTELRGVERSGNDLVIKYGTNDQVNVGYYFYSDSFKIEQIKFSDGVTWNVTNTQYASVINGTGGNDSLSSSGYSAGQRVYGQDGNDTITGSSYNDLLDGGSGTDSINGGVGSDILQGGSGNDVLTDTSGNNLFNGGADNDALTGGSGNELFIGGTGNDTITTSSGYDIIAFNRGDGQDTVISSTGKDNTISLGGGIAYADLAFNKSSNDLILATGSGEQITFKDWYANTNNHSIANLQMAIESSADYSAASDDAMHNKKIEQFNFDGLASAFDQARSADPTLTTWSLSSSMLNFYLGGTDTAAIGGDLAYQYAKSGSLSNISATPAQALLGSTQFGVTNQNLQSLSALQDISSRLA